MERKQLIKNFKNDYRKLRLLFMFFVDILKIAYYKLVGQKIMYSYYARVNNFGDLFNKDLISYFNVKLIYVNNYKRSQASLLGSILGMYPREF